MTLRLNNARAFAHTQAATAAVTSFDWLGTQQCEPADLPTKKPIQVIPGMGSTSLPASQAYLEMHRNQGAAGSTHVMYGSIGMEVASLDRWSAVRKFLISGIIMKSYLLRKFTPNSSSSGFFST